MVRFFCPAESQPYPKCDWADEDVRASFWAPNEQTSKRASRNWQEILHRCANNTLIAQWLCHRITILSKCFASIVYVRLNWATLMEHIYLSFKQRRSGVSFMLMPNSLLNGSANQIRMPMIKCWSLKQKPLFIVHSQFNPYNCLISKFHIFVPTRKQYISWYRLWLFPPQYRRFFFSFSLQPGSGEESAIKRERMSD